MRHVLYFLLLLIASCGFQNVLDLRLNSQVFSLNSGADIGDSAAQLSILGVESPENCSFQLNNFQNIFSINSQGQISLIMDNPTQGSYPLEVEVACPPIPNKLFIVNVIVDELGIVIPTLPWVTHLGSATVVPGGSTAGHDECESVGTDRLGNVYCGGWTRGNMGETNAGFSDLMIFKLSPEGNLLWLRQFGTTTQGPGGDTTGDEFCIDMAVDPDGNIYCGGRTNSDLAENAGIGFDAFVVKLNTDGNLLWARQLGAVTTIPGGGSEGIDQCRGIDFDDLGNVYCGGTTRSNTGEANGGGDDAFVMKLDPLGNIVWLTQFGALTLTNGVGSTSGDESCESVDIDSQGNVFCGGSTTGNLGEVNGGGGLEDAFVLKLDSSGNLLWVTQFGASFDAVAANGECRSVAVDSSDNVFCGGSTQESLGEANGGGFDVFIAKLNGVTGASLFISQLGAVTSIAGGNNSGDDNCRAVKVDASGVYCGGDTSGSLGEAASTGADTFMGKFSLTGNLLWLTQLGSVTSIPGGSNTGADVCNAITIDDAGNSFCAGITQSDYSEGFGGVQDAYIIKFDPNGVLQ